MGLSIPGQSNSAELESKTQHPETQSLQHISASSLDSSRTSPTSTVTLNRHSSRHSTQGASCSPSPHATNPLEQTQQTQQPQQHLQPQQHQQPHQPQQPQLHQQHQQSRQPPAPVHSPQHPNADIHTTTSEATTPVDLSSPSLTHGPAHQPHTAPPSAPEPSKTNSSFTHLTSKLTLQS